MCGYELEVHDDERKIKRDFGKGLGRDEILNFIEANI